MDLSLSAGDAFDATRTVATATQGGFGGAAFGDEAGSGVAAPPCRWLVSSLISVFSPAAGSGLAGGLSKNGSIPAPAASFPRPGADRQAPAPVRDADNQRARAFPQAPLPPIVLAACLPHPGYSLRGSATLRGQRRDPTTRRAGQAILGTAAKCALVASPVKDAKHRRPVRRSLGEGRRRRRRP
jgi:hypothetical protein